VLPLVSTLAYPEEECSCDFVEVEEFRESRGFGEAEAWNGLRQHPFLFSITLLFVRWLPLSPPYCDLACFE